MAIIIKNQKVKFKLNDLLDCEILLTGNIHRQEACWRFSSIPAHSKKKHWFQTWCDNFYRNPLIHLLTCSFLNQNRGNLNTYRKMLIIDCIPNSLSQTYFWYSKHYHMTSTEGQPPWKQTNIGKTRRLPCCSRYRWRMIWETLRIRFLFWDNIYI